MPAQYVLGILYELGIGCPKSETVAKYWYGKAAEQGYDDAKRCLDRLEAK